jgi:hypothetical protein
MDNEFSNENLLTLTNKAEKLLIPYKVDINIYKNIDNQDLIEHIKNLSNYIKGPFECTYLHQTSFLHHLSSYI